MALAGTQCTGTTGITGTYYTYAQLEGIWINNGGDKSLAPIAAAIAMAESAGCSAAVNPYDNGGTQTSWGLWQISNGTHSQPVQNILDPNVNAQQAAAKYKAAGGWSPWGTYSSGAYKAFMSNSTTPDTSVPGGLGPSQQQQQGGNTLGNTSACLITIPNINPVPSWVPILGSSTGFCLLSKPQGRALIAGAMLAAAGLWTMVGLGLVIVQGFAGSGAGHAAGGALETVGAGVAVIPGGQGAGLAIGSAGATARRAGSGPSGGRQSLERRRAARAGQQRKQVEGGQE